MTATAPATAAAVTNAAGIALIKTWEGLRLAAYHDSGGAWTIGYGHRIGVTGGEQITAAQADALLAQDLACFERGVAALASSPSSNEFSAMVSLAFNIGLGAFGSSTALRQHNAGATQAAADAFLLWNKAHVDGQLVELAGLTARREAERQLYLTADTPPAPPPTDTVLFEGTDKSGAAVQIIQRVGAVGAIVMMLGGAAALGMLRHAEIPAAAAPAAAAVQPAIELFAELPLAEPLPSELEKTPSWRFGRADGGRLTVECRQPDGAWPLCPARAPQ